MNTPEEILDKIFNNPKLIAAQEKQEQLRKAIYFEATHNSYEVFKSWMQANAYLIKELNH